MEVAHIRSPQRGGYTILESKQGDMVLGFKSLPHINLIPGHLFKRSQALNDLIMI